MGLRNWMAKNVAGPSAYGETMGRSAVGNGLALGRILYLGHGTHSGSSANCVFGTSEAMIAGGYTVYCADPNQKPPLENKSQLSVLTRAAGIAFAASLAMNAAQLCFRFPENRSRFNRAVGAATVPALNRHCPDVSPQLVERFVRLEPPRPVERILDTENPGIGDMFGAFLSEISRQHQGGSVAFIQRGILGFDAWAVSLAEETTSAVERAAKDFHW